MDSPTEERSAPAPDATERRGAERRVNAHPAEAGRRRPAAAGGLLTLAVGTATVGAAATVVGVVVGVARVASSQERIAPIGAAAVAMAILALCVPAVAAGLAPRRTAAAGALLAGAGAVSLGMCVLDLQLWLDPLDADRLELFRPLGAAGIDAGAGAVLVLAGHACLVLAGAAGLAVVQRCSHADGYGWSPDPEAAGRPAGSRMGGGAVAAVLVAAAVLSAALLAPPFTTRDPVILARPAIAADAATAIGTAVVILAALAVVASALAAVDVTVAAGAIAGAALVAGTLAVTRLTAGLAGDRLEVGAGAVWGTAATIALVATAALAPPLAARRERRPAPVVTRTSARRAAGTARDGLLRWHTACGVTGLAGGALVAAGSLLPMLTLPPGLPEPAVPAVRVVFVAGVLLAVASVWLMLSEFSVMCRPVVSVLWVAVVAAAGGVAQSVLAAVEIPGVGPGAGAVLVGLGALVAVATGVLAGVAGAVERDDVDTSEPVEPERATLTVGLAAVVVTVLGFAFPLYRGSDGTAAALGRLPWGWDTWGLALATAAVVAAVLVALGARPARGAALLCGAALVAGLHVLGWPLLAGRLADPVAGAGAAPAILSVVLLVVSAALVGRRKDR